MTIPPVILVTPVPDGRTLRFIAEVPGLPEVRVSATSIPAALEAVAEAYEWYVYERTRLLKAPPDDVARPPHR